MQNDHPTDSNRALLDSSLMLQLDSHRLAYTSLTPHFPGIE